VTYECVCFEITATAEAQTLPRLLNFFAQRDLTPSLVQAQVVGAAVIVVIAQAFLEPGHAAVIAEKMRCSVCVQDVKLRGPPNRRPASQRRPDLHPRVSGGPPPFAK
jgi:hypothetical protein